MRSPLFAVAVVLVACGSGFGQVAPGVNTPASPGPDVAAVVNGQPIMVAELDAALNAALGTVPLTANQRRQLRATLLHDLIDDALLGQFLAKHGPKVEPAEIDAQMTALKGQLLRENRTLEQHLKDLGQTEAQLRADWETSIQLAGYVKKQVTDEQLKGYHAANRDHFDKAEVRFSQIVIRVGRSAPAVERAAAKEKLQALRADLLTGKFDFPTAARKFSQCPTALKGGDRGFIVRRGSPEDEPLAKAAFALKVGELSDVVETDHGWHLILVTDRKPGTPRTIEKCIVEVLEAYTDDYRAELVAKLRKEAKIQIALP